METRVYKKEGKKLFNRFGEELVKCKGTCGGHTTMTGTKLCDRCWEATRKK